MTRDEIIKLAREAGGVPAGDGTFIAGTIEWERFAALVAAAEREACAKLLDEMAAQDKWSNYYQVASKAIREREKT